MIREAPLQLSPSAVRAYRSCPYRYARDYVDRLPDDFRRPVFHLAYGSAIHQALAYFIRHGGQSRLSKDDLIVALMDHWDSSAYPNEDTELDRFYEARRMLESFYDQPYPQEVKRELGIEERLTWSTPRRGIRAVGKLDRICLLPDGTLDVIDYKTGACPEDGEDLPKDPQALIYRSLAGEAYRRLNPGQIQVTFHYLVSGASVNIRYDHEDFIYWWSMIDDVAARIRNSMSKLKAGAPLWQAFPIRRGNQCRRCPLEAHCDASAYPSEDELPDLPQEGRTR